VSLEAGQVIQGKYRITRLLGEGGMGAVYQGENVRIHRKVAIKVLHAAFTENQEVVQRFEREAQAAGHIGNDHILEVLDLGQLDDGDLFLVMEYLDGEALSDRVRKLGRMSPEQMVPLMLEVLEGLAAAHDAGIIHRDLKPDNIFILKEKAGHKDFVKIIDFGISKFQPMSGEGMKMTKTGAMMGTPYYMSPEQATGSREADARSDIYALGVIIYECVTGTVPFDAPSFNQLLFKIALTTPPPLEQVRPDLDEGFCSIVAKAMAREVDDRFADCKSFAEALTAWSKDRQGVSVPPPVDEEALHADVVNRASAVAVPDATVAADMVPDVEPVAAPDGVPGGATTGNWATTHADGQRRGGAMAIAAVVGLLVVGGGGFAAYKALGSGEDASAAAQPAPGTSPDELAKVLAEKKAAEEAAKKAEAEKKAAEEAAQKAAAEKAEAEKRAAEEAAEREAAEKAAEEAEKAAPVVRRRVVRRAAPRPAPKPAAAPAPAPAPKPAGGGDLDFGY
jgi:serine/threonine-protein kinase